MNIRESVSFPILLVNLFFLAVSAWAGSDDGVVRHDLRISLHPETSSLEGVDVLTFDPEGARVVTLLLAAGSDVRTVTLDGEPADHRVFQGRVEVSIPDDKRHGELDLQVVFQGIFKDPVPERPAHNEDPTYGVAASISPQGVFLGGGEGWYPELPGRRAIFTLTIASPEGFEAVSSGRRVDHGQGNGHSYSKWQTSHPLHTLTLSAGPYQVREDVVDSIPVYAYFYRQTQQLAEAYLQATRRYLHMYQELFGPYPFEKFAVVENFFPTGYGFPSWTLLGSSVVRLPFIVETSLGHEIAHSWWGTGVGVEYRQGNWSEGLTTYVADHLYKEQESSAAGRAYRLNILRDYASLVHVGNDVPLARFLRRDTKASQAIGYGKAAMVFHMARQRIGDAAFWEGLHRMADAFLFKEASWQDFAEMFGRTANADLQTFFDQWVKRPGAPELRLERVKTTVAGKEWQVEGELVQHGEIFDLQVPLQLETDGKQIRQVVQSAGRATPFAFRIKNPPSRLVVDPEVDLFRRLDPSEVPPTVNGLRGARNLLVVVARDLSPELLEAARDLLVALRHDQAPVVAEQRVAPADLKGHDVLFLGRPSNPALLPSLPESLKLTADFFELEDKVYRQNETALFAALPHPYESSRMSALFLPPSPEAARSAARKIPHYGKYSFLAFDDGINQAKGTWPVVQSPTIYLFNQEPNP